MSVNYQIDQSVQQLCAWYGDGRDGSCPSTEQWRQVIERPPNQSITLINFFKFRQIAAYPKKDLQNRECISGQEAFKQYSSVSIPTMERVGGKFLLVGPFDGMLLGEGEDWDLIAVGSYPDIQSFMGLYSDLDYRSAFRHRTAACERQKVIVCSG